jgi:hypothetical protein
METIVKALLKIVGGGFVVFMVLAVSQEWAFFRSAWFGDDVTAESASDADLREAAEAVRTTLVMMRHLYTSGGDVRFAERMPASDAMVREMLDDIDYLHRNRRVQDPNPRSIDIREAIAIDAEHVEIRTRELWDIRTTWLDGGAKSDPPRITVVHGLYRVRRSSSGWTVQSWDWVETPEPVTRGSS